MQTRTLASDSVSSGLISCNKRATVMRDGSEAGAETAHSSPDFQALERSGEQTDGAQQGLWPLQAATGARPFVSASISLHSNATDLAL